MVNILSIYSTVRHFTDHRALEMIHLIDGLGPDEENYGDENEGNVIGCLEYLRRLHAKATIIASETTGCTGKNWRK